MQKHILFDADGVLTLPEETFSVVYARSRGLDLQPFEDFFRTEWSQYVTGKRDLKTHIAANPQLWKWQGTAEELIHYWCSVEDIRNDELIRIVKALRSRGVLCYLATEQERYRGEYMEHVMFKSLFDNYFITAQIGYKKSDPSFYTYVLEALRENNPDLQPQNVLFFDDSQSKVDAALSVGLKAYPYTDITSFRAILKNEQILLQ